MQALFRIEVLRAARRLAAALVLALCPMGCLQDGQGAPPLAGPSALALSIRLSATPDVLPMDGAARSVVTITATRPNGIPAVDLRLVVRIVEGSTAHDVGSSPRGPS